MSSWFLIGSDRSFRKFETSGADPLHAFQGCAVKTSIRTPAIHDELGNYTLVEPVVLLEVLD